MLDTLLHGEKKNVIARCPSDLDSVEPSRIFAIDIETRGAEGRPGDCPGGSKHGICGIAICNLQGQAAYCVVNDGKEYGGANIVAVVEYLNRRWFLPGRIAVMHNAKFDMGFLIARGIAMDRVTVRDTWAVSSIASEGIYTSNALKELVREKFQIETDSETRIKEYLEKAKTKDYGELPVELIGPYACDDVRYTLALSFTQKFDETAQASHDLVVRNSQALIAAELRGARVDVPLLANRVKVAQERADQHYLEFQKLMGSAVLPHPDEDDQSAMRVLHQKKIHSGPRSYFGETKFVPDFEFMATTGHALALTFSKYRRYRDFLTCFSGRYGQMRDRIWGDAQTGGVYPGFQCSVFSRGGLSILKRPNVADEVRLTNEIRELFIARDGHDFVILKAMDLNAQMLAFYTRNVHLEKAVGCGGGEVCKYLGRVAGCTPEGASLLLRKIIEGSGFALLERRFKLAGARVSNVYDMAKKFEANLPGYAGMMLNLDRSLRNEKVLRDRGGRRIRIPENKQHRKHAILFQSSFGSICSNYLNLFGMIAKSTGAHLVLAHRDEFVFEVSEGDVEFEKAVAALLKRKVMEPQPTWLMNKGKKWFQEYVDAEDWVSSRWG